MKRTFIAIKTSITNNGLKILQDIKINLKDEKIRWIQANNLHITIFFLGNTDENIINDITYELANSLNAIGAFNIQCQGLGVFRNYHNPKAFWLGVSGSEKLHTIKLKIDKIMNSFGFVIGTKDYIPHLTIGRTNRIKNKTLLKSVLKNFEKTKFQELRVKEIYFYESQLTSTGPVYRVLSKIPLD